MIGSLLCISAGCVKTRIPVVEGGEIAAGDPVVFTTMVPDVRKTKSAAEDVWKAEVQSYKAVSSLYSIKVEMFRQGVAESSGNAMYEPVMDAEGEYSSDGTLTVMSDSHPLYWQDNVNKWGFRATAGTETLESDQSTEESWFAQDKLLGYSYLPIWDEEQGRGTDDFNAINYRTSKEWYADNKLAKDLSGLMPQSSEDYKKIPLYMQHQRAWVTVILKAGEGVTREALAYSTSGTNISTSLYSYVDGAYPRSQAITAWSTEAKINYEADKNGDAATGVSTTRYDAIIEPHNFIASRSNEESDILARISVSNQNFTFAAANDSHYAKYIAGPGADGYEEALAAMQAYNLEAGKHLTITATLSRASRMIMITAWIEDWTETVNQTICDDYGQNGDPVLINNRKELIAFLEDTEKNKAGNVGLIVPNAMTLVDTTWNTDNYTLKATLNLANSQITTNRQFLKEIERTGSLVNGEIRIADKLGDNPTSVTTAIAGINKGTIERVRVTTSGETSPARATVAAFAGINYGTIYQCSSALTIQGASGYVGGIAAQSLVEAESGVNPTIDGCIVTARVDGSESVVAGGGIVGQAEGRVSNNTFDYGITIMQNGAIFQNIIASLGTNALTAHSNNSWPTTAEYIVTNTDVHIINANTGRYDAIIDNIDELKQLLTSANNVAGRSYRVANSFTVDKENWIWGSDILADEYFVPGASSVGCCHGEVRFALNGNGKTVTMTGETHATMLFGSVIGQVYDLNLYLDKPIVADRIFKENAKNESENSNTDAIAAFAYSVTVSGTAKGEIRNINVKAGSSAYIKASTPGGLVVWASHGGKIVGCATDVPVQMSLSSTAGVDARHYAGGIVACAQKATISQCRYYNDHGLNWASENEKAKQSNCRYGGIVGGTSEMTNTEDEPELELSDCSSWWTLPEFSNEETVRPVMGSLIGSTVYHDNQTLLNAMKDGNAGNWWVGNNGAGLLMTGVKEDKAIGKKNSVNPSKPKDW